MFCCAVYSYVSFYQSGNPDLFVAASLFVPPMAVFSVGAVLSKLVLMRRRIEQRRADAIARADRETAVMTPAARRAVLRMLMERFLLQHDQRDFEERKSANDARRYEGFGYIFGVVSEVRSANFRRIRIVRLLPRTASLAYLDWRQDLPFGVINSIFLARIVHDRDADDADIRSKFELQLLILLTSVVMFMYKVMHLREFPGVWREHELLLVEKRRLAERRTALSAQAAHSESCSGSASASASASGSASGSGSDSEPTDGTVSGFENSHMGMQPTSKLVECLVGRQVPSATPFSQELAIDYDRSSNRVAVSLRELRHPRTQPGSSASATDSDTSALRSSHLQCGGPRTELTSFEICMLPECGR